MRKLLQRPGLDSTSRTKASALVGAILALYPLLAPTLGLPMVHLTGEQQAAVVVLLSSVLAYFLRDGMKATEESQSSSDAGIGMASPYAPWRSEQVWSSPKVGSDASKARGVAPDYDQPID